MRLFRADLGLESPSYGKGRSRVLHPSPPARLPFQGRGVPVRFTLQPKTQNPPLAPIGGEGSGVRGNTTPKTRGRSSPKMPDTAAVHINRQLCDHWALCGLKNTPDASHCRADLGQESPSYGEGRSRVFHPSPPTPLPFQGRGVPVHFTAQKYKSPTCVSSVKIRVHPWRKTPRNPWRNTPQSEAKKPPTAQSGTTPDPRAASPR
jgi:hypothetical protein